LIQHARWKIKKKKYFFIFFVFFIVQSFDTCCTDFALFILIFYITKPQSSSNMCSNLRSGLLNAKVLYIAIYPGGPATPLCRGFTMTIRRHTTLGRTPLDEWSGRRRDLYLITYNTYKRQRSTPPPNLRLGFELAVPASERPKTHALDRTATGVSYVAPIIKKIT